MSCKNAFSHNRALRLATFSLAILILALLPIGAYTPRWFMHYAHMDIPEVLRAFDDLGAEIMIPTQWGVLKLGDEPAAWPMQVLQEALTTTHQNHADRVKILPIGGRLVLE